MFVERVGGDGMKEGWEYKKLGEVCNIQNGFAFKSSRYVNNGIRVIRITNVQKGEIVDDSPKFYPIESVGEIKNFILDEGDLLMSLTGNVGRVGLLPKHLLPAALNQRVACLRIKDKSVLLQYLYVFLNSDYFEQICIKNSTGAAQLNMSTIWLSKFLIPIPPLSEQHRIVSYLDSSFAKIDEMKANAAKALSEAKALFQAELKKCMEKKEGWEEKTLKEIGLTQTGTTPSKNNKDNYGDYIPFIRPAELNVDGNGMIEYNSQIMLSEQGLKNGRLFKKGSILMCCIGTVGKTGYTTQDVSCNQQINILTPKEGINGKFCYYALISPSFQNAVVSIANSAQATLPIINKGKWEQLTISIPPFPIQHQIVTHLDSLSQKVNELQQNYNTILADCDALKQAILKETFE